MFNLGKAIQQSRPKSRYTVSQLQVAPSAANMNDLLAHATFMLGNPISLVWRSSSDAKTHTLSVQCRNRTSEPLWTMHQNQDGAESLLWSIASNDILFIFNLVMYSAGEQTAVAADSIICCTEATPTQPRKYYMRVQSPQSQCG